MKEIRAQGAREDCVFWRVMDSQLRCHITQGLASSLGCSGKGCYYLEIANYPTIAAHVSDLSILFLLTSAGGVRLLGALRIYPTN